MSLLTDPLDPAFNSFASLQAADNYHALRSHHETWVPGLTDNEKHLASATLLIQTEIDEQHVAESIPKGIMQACCELAFTLLSEDITIKADQQVESQTIGPIKTNFKLNDNSMIPEIVQRLLKPYLKNNNSLKLVRTL